MQIHRLLGYAYLAMYIVLMWQMVPRLWAYQIELPARTVFHLTLGVSIGVILLIKIAIVRYYKHMEARLVPILGVALLVCTMLLIFLALPFSLREAYLSSQALSGDDGMTRQRIERVREQLPKAGIEDSKIIDQLATHAGLRSGRQELMAKCTQCHDLRTVLARPRTPQSWKQTVERMANRSTVLNPITKQNQLEITAYLIAISPTLQQTLVERRHQAMESAKKQQSSMKMAEDMMGDGDSEVSFTPEQARTTFESRCSQCHEPTQIENAPPASKDAANKLVQRMIGYGLLVSDDELKQILDHIGRNYITGDSADSEESTDSAASGTSDTQTTVADASTTVNGSDGEALYNQSGCIGCHGIEGKTPLVSTYPVLAGQNSAYLVQQIQDIKSGNRNNGLASVMQGVVAGLTDEQIEAISEYLSVQSP